jgi:hypothetical protein
MFKCVENNGMVIIDIFEMVESSLSLYLYFPQFTAGFTEII